MKAAILNSPQDVLKHPLQIVDVPRPELVPGHVLLRVRACGVCRTDLHIVEGELRPRRRDLIPGHQIVGDIIDGATAEFPIGTRVGVSWIGGIDGTCWYCKKNLENLCDAPVFTGYTVNGGYAEYALARSDFVFALPSALDDLQAAPLLCAGIIGFRSLRVAGVEEGERVGLFGFGASAHLAIAVLRAWKCEVYVSTRGDSHRQLAVRWELRGLALKRTNRQSNSTGRSLLHRAETWLLPHWPACAKAGWSPLTQFIWTVFRSSTMIDCSGASVSFGVSRI